MGFLSSIFGGSGGFSKDAQQGFNQASGAANTYGNAAQGINANLTPFLTRELNNPQGYSQQDLTSLTSNALAGAGGATSGLQSAAAERAAATNNPSGFATALDQAARERGKAAAGASEGIAAKNADLKQTQQQDAARGLSNLYGEDVGGQMKALGIEPQDVKAGVDANQDDTFNRLMKFMNTAASGAMAGAKIAGVPGM